MVFRARFDSVLVLVLPIIVLATVTNSYFTWKRSGFEDLVVLGVPIVGEALAFAFFALWVFASRYEIDGENLRIRTGLVQKTVLLRDLTSVYVPAPDAKPSTSKFTTRHLRFEAENFAMSCVVPQDEKGFLAAIEKTRPGVVKPEPPPRMLGQ